MCGEQVQIGRGNDTRQIPAIQLAAESARLMRPAIEAVRSTELAVWQSPNDEP
jgi:hypothetical protein